MDNLDTFLSLRREGSREKWWNDLRRADPPPFLGPLLSIKEAAAALNRSISTVRHNIDEGRLNTWKDPVSRRVWVLKDDVDLLRADRDAYRERLESRRSSRPKPKRESNPQSEIPDPQLEDLDAIGGWEAPKPPEPRGAAGYLEDQEKEREEKYRRQVRETEEWYAAELAKLEGRDPEEAVRQLQIDRGWLTPDSHADSANEPGPGSMPSARSARPKPAIRNPKSAIARPISWSNPHTKPRAKPEPWVDPDDQTAIPNPDSEIERPFPIGWIRAPAAMRVLDCSEATLIRLAGAGKIQRRRVPNPPTKPVYLYDSVEVERLAEARADRVSHPLPNKDLRWWGSRAADRPLTEFDWWISTVEAARVLNVTPARIRHMCDSGLLPCHQKEPGKMGSRIRLSYLAVLLLSRRREYLNNRARWEKGRNRTAEARGWQEHDIEPYDPRQRTGAASIDHGTYYTTRQAAIELGISVWSVHALRKRGRLEGHRLDLSKRVSPGRRYWFFLKEDVHNLQADHDYNVHSRRGKRAQLPPALRDNPEP